MRVGERRAERVLHLVGRLVGVDHQFLGHVLDPDANLHAMPPVVGRVPPTAGGPASDGRTEIAGRAAAPLCRG
ncbi:hypothetical protein GCM10010187_67120 [Actinomadura coerulea]|nr:hypothetical protein GCM10010187_67120 [Actinomadura coerulea]